MNNHFSHRLKPAEHCLFLLLFLAIASCQTPESSGNGPVKPENALATFQLEPGFKIELIAAEPLVSDPVDMEIDEEGRLYIVEMHGYPLDKSGAGQIKLLSDSDGDGKLDKSVVFADGLTLPFGIMRWKQGVLVADAPDILYLEDSDGDGKADVKKVMLTGFAFSNAQMNAGNPLYGLDNWIYLTSESGGTYQIYKEDFGDLGSDIHYPDVTNSPRLALAGRGRTVRFRPDGHKLELTSGMTQFGHDFDDWGHHLLGNNSNHIYHEVINASYLMRNPDLPVSNATQTLSDHGGEVFSITKKPERQLLTNVGIFTSACGNTLYSGGAFPPPFNERINFVAEPVSNIVHADLLSDDGASFKASRVGNGPNKEFLGSTDSWFRPVNMYVGPDGALYVLDYYRQIIEHPEWMSEEAVKSGDLYNGRDMGRIYRISALNSEPAGWIKGLTLGNRTILELVEELSNPNIWWRKNAQRLLVDRNDKQTIPALIGMAKTSGSAQGRLHALWTLEGLGELTGDVIEIALKDTVAGIRENAIKLSELHLKDFPALKDALLFLETDPDPKVRFQLLCTLGFIDNPKAAEVRNRLLFRDLQDQWVQIAALSASGTQGGDLLNTLIQKFKPGVPAYASMVQRLASMLAASGDAKNIQRLIHKATYGGAAEKYSWQASVLEGVAEGLPRRKLPAVVLKHEQKLLLSVFFKHPSPELRKPAFRILKHSGIEDVHTRNTAISRAVAIARDTSIADERRAEAIDFLALDDPSSHASLLKELIKPQERPSVQLAALNTLSLIPGREVSDYVLACWEKLTPEIRNAAINTFLASEERVASLLNAIDSGTVQKASVSFYHSVRLMTQRDQKLRSRARSMFAANDEEKVNKDFQQALALTGDGMKGKTVYEKNCSMCHQMRGSMGFSFGPDLGTISNWQTEGILANIVSPNLSIAAGYELWQVEMVNGESLQGVISSETPAAISIKNAGTAERMINRQDIKSLKTVSISGMPSGLAKNISQQEMADLLAFLRQKE